MCKFKLFMNILNMYVLQCILCASERKISRTYGTLQLKIISIIKKYEMWYI